VATPGRQLDLAETHEQVLDICRNLLAELGNPRALSAVRGAAHLDRDLGLGSLERVELMLRLDSAFGTRLPDQAVAEADTIDDLVAAVAVAMRATPVGGTPDRIADKQARIDISVREELRVAPGQAQGAPGVATTVFTTRTDRGVEAAETLQEVLRYRARFDGHRPHLIFPEDPSPSLGTESSSATLGKGETPNSPKHTITTFGELYARAETVAQELARRGVGPGHTVAIMLPTSVEFFYTFAGILLAGAIPVPIYPPFRADRIAEYAERQSAILQNAEARLLVTFRQAETVARLLQPRVPSLQGVVSATRLAEPPATRADEAGSSEPRAASRRFDPAPWRPHRAHGNDIALLQYTSGSTGDPKGVILTHANLLANIRAIAEAVEVRPGDVGVTWLPLYHDMGLIGAWMMPLCCGLSVVVLSPLAFLSRPERWLWAVHNHRGTLAAAPNFAYELCVRKIADRDIEGLDLSSWRAALNGAEPVNPETLERFTQRFAPYGFRREALLPVYGLAEASLAVTVPPLGKPSLVDRIDRATFEREGRAVPVAPDAPRDDPNVTSFVSVGRPVPGHEVRLVDAQGRDAGERVEGALWFRGPSVTRGYYRNAEATRRLFPESGVAAASLDSTGEKWLDSGDRAYQAEGEIYVTGRVKDIIIKAGRNLYPHEIEELAGRVEGVRKGCVVAFGVTDPITGTERLVIVAELRERAAAKESELRAHVTQAITEAVLAALGIPPDVVELVPPHSIPKTSSGKLRREETKRLYRTGALAARTPPTWLQVAKLAAASGVAGVGQWLRRGLDLAYGVYATVVFGGWIVPTWLLVLVTPSRRLSAWLTSNALKVYMALVGCRIRVQGREHLRDAQARVFVSNHTSYFDVLVLMAALGVNYRFVSKMEVRSMPFIGTFLRKLGHVWFDRSDPQARLRQAAEIEQLLRDGESVFVFPEGTFTPQSGVRPFQLGAFKAAVTTCRPICPVALCGTRQFLRDQTYLPRPSSVTVTICPPLEPARNTSPSDWHEMVRLRDAARAAIAQHCGEQIL